MKEVCSALFVSILILNGTYAQDFGEEYNLNTNWSVGLGISVFEVDAEKVSVIEWNFAFPSLNIPIKDYSTWITDERLASEPTLIPTCIMVDLGLPFKKARSEWLQNTEWRPALSLGYSDCYNGNMEKITGNTAVGGIFSREMIMVNADANMWVLHNSIIHQTRHIGKNKRLRFGFGLGMAISVATIRAYSYHVQGTYISTGENAEYHNWNVYPADAITHSWQMLGEAKGSTLGIGFEVPLSFEFLIGKRRRTHIGEQMYFGNTYLNKINGEGFSVFTMNGAVTLRFDL